MLFQAVFGVLAVTCVGIQVYVRSKSSTTTTSTKTTSNKQTTTEFKSFQRTYLLIYLSTMFCDWMMGPYLYELYSSYGYDNGEIAAFFLTGFVSSMAFGTFVGSLADKFGRKKACQLFAVLYIIANFAKLNNTPIVLYLGHLASGIGTSLLHSAFEAWMVHEHKSRNYPDEGLSETFAHATLGNGLVAILAGLVAGQSIPYLGPPGPFMLSGCGLFVPLILISLLWGENYGDQQAAAGQSLSTAMHDLRSDLRVPVLGMMQALFEAAMYTFVFMWSPAIKNSGVEGAIPYGLIFSSMMVAIMIGSSLFGEVVGKIQPLAKLATIVFGVAALAFGVSVVSPQSPLLLMCSFMLFELCCGVYFPLAGTLRGQTLPEQTRSTIMNLFRLPLNAMVVVVLLQVDNFAQGTVFCVCAGWLVLALLLSQVFLSMKAPKKKKAN